MLSLKKFLKLKTYISIKLSTSTTNHYAVKMKINGKTGRFILDTGASNTCIAISEAAYFKLNTTESKVKATGAGTNNMPTLTSKKNKINIGKWKSNKASVIVIDLSHVNEALANHSASTVSGILGADILKKGKAIIDYENHRLYLKQH